MTFECKISHKYTHDEDHWWSKGLQIWWLWDWGATYCATEAHRTSDLKSLARFKSSFDWFANWFNSSGWECLLLLTMYISTATYYLCVFCYCKVFVCWLSMFHKHPTVQAQHAIVTFSDCHKQLLFLYVLHLAKTIICMFCILQKNSVSKPSVSSVQTHFCGFLRLSFLFKNCSEFTDVFIPLN